MSMDGQSAAAVFFDGLTAARRDVRVMLTPQTVAIHDAAGALLEEWPLPQLKHMSAPAHVFRIGLRQSERLARLEIEDQEMAHAIDLACPDIDRSGANARRARRQAVLWSIAATVSLLLVAVYGVPSLADRLAPLVPQGVEIRLGVAADNQARAMLQQGPDNRPLECGTGPGEAAGLAAFNKLMGELQAASGLKVPLRAAVIRRDEANAITLPGGHIYVFKGLVDQARSVDEVAGVIAHELGHVQGRDGMRTILQAAGLSVVFGILLGDFVGGGAVVLAAESLLKSAYSRDKEAAADDYAVRTMLALKGDVRALGRFLGRIAGSSGKGSIFLDHPATPDRIARIDAIAPPQSGGARLLDAAEWAALKRICAGYR
jgi:hypothetical protein